MLLKRAPDWMTPPPLLNALASANLVNSVSIEAINTSENGDQTWFGGGLCAGKHSVAQNTC